MNARVPVARPIDPTEIELRAVWMTVRGRPGWPATFEEAMRDPIQSRLLVLNAKHPPKAVRSGRTTSAPSMPLPRSTTRALPMHAAVPAGLDRKRAAAGDRDD
ncbi:hypothetical protein ACFPOE_11475 [Caenimonas terrae]|uniref:Uncharacterized protein n=1 Tax=Caenimonas terrae TaxID=696074 RepID=A0ABW0NFV0_9BURK